MERAASLSLPGGAAHRGAAMRSQLQQCAAGDERAWAALVADHQRAVFQVAMHLLGDHDDALDLSQEVFLRVFRTIHRFRGQSSLRTWIYRIAINQARNRQRSWRRRHRHDQTLFEHTAGCGDLCSASARRPDSVFTRKDLASRLQGALEALPFTLRTAIVLREIEGLSYDELAAALGVTRGTVKARLTRARHVLRRQLWNVRPSS